MVTGLLYLDPEAGDAAVGGPDLFDRGVQSQLAAELLEELDQRPDQRPGSAFDKEHSPVAFEVVDQGVDG